MLSPSADVIFNKNFCALSGFVFCPVTKQAVVGERWLSPGRRLTHLKNGRMKSKTRRGGGGRGEAFLSFSTLKFPAHVSTEKGCSGNTS